MKKIGILITALVVIFGFYFAENFLMEKIFPVKTNILNEECVPYTHFWIEDYQEYFKNHDMKQKIRNLKKGMDRISAEYINQYMKNSKYWNKCINLCKGYSEDNLWTKYDKKLFSEFENIELPEIYSKFDYSPFIYKNLYGMKDLPKEILDRINGKDIIDIGAAPGEATYTFHKYFTKSNIYAYEPILEEKKGIDLMVTELNKEDSSSNLIHTIQKGISDREYIEDNMSWHNHTTYNIKIVSLDYEYPKIGNNNLGLIKMDIEGMESAAIRGAENIIKQYKPVLVISIYHAPEDFFEMKDKIKELSPDYKFMLRRSDNVFPDVDLVLIAY